MEEGPQRFGAPHRRLEGISPKALTNTLRRLESKGFAARTVYPAVPPHGEYQLAPLGRSVAVPLAQLRHWAGEHMDEIREAEPAQPRRGRGPWCTVL